MLESNIRQSSISMPTSESGVKSTHYYSSPASSPFACSSPEVKKKQRSMFAFEAFRSMHSCSTISDEAALPNDNVFTTSNHVRSEDVAIGSDQTEVIATTSTGDVAKSTLTLFTLDSASDFIEMDEFSNRRDEDQRDVNKPSSENSPSNDEIKNKIVKRHAMTFESDAFEKEKSKVNEKKDDIEKSTTTTTSPVEPRHNIRSSGSSSVFGYHPVVLRNTVDYKHYGGECHRHHRKQSNQSNSGVADVGYSGSSGLANQTLTLRLTAEWRRRLEEPRRHLYVIADTVDVAAIHHRDAIATPSQAIATPSQAIATPSQAIATPSQAIATPSQAIATPSQAIATPSQAIATPSQAIATPSQAIATPSQAHLLTSTPVTISPSTSTLSSTVAANTSPSNNYRATESTFGEKLASVVACAESINSALTNAKETTSSDNIVDILILLMCDIAAESTVPGVGISRSTSAGMGARDGARDENFNSRLYTRVMMLSDTMPRFMFTGIENFALVQFTVAFTFLLKLDIRIQRK